MSDEKDFETLNIKNIEINSLADASVEMVNGNSSGNSNVNLVFNLNIYDSETIKKIVSFAREVKNAGYNVSIGIKAASKHFTATDMWQFLRLEDNLKKDKINLNFDGGIDKNYNINEVIIAQKKLNDLIDTIKQEPLSPFEKYLIIYDFLTRKIYHENEKNKAKSRDIIALMNGDDIVCVGYAQLMEYICNAVGIKCYTQACKTYNKNDRFLANHENNLVYIDDDKYDIHGLYLSDACWDRVDEGKEDKRTYSFCLVPLSDKNCLGKKIKVSDDAMFFYPNDEYALKSIDGDYYGETFGKDSSGNYSKIIKLLGLEEKYNISEEVVKDLVGDKYKCNYAAHTLKNIFKSYDVPADIYQVKPEVPYGSSFEFLLSLCMLGGIDDKFVSERIKMLKKNYSSDKKLDFKDSARSYVVDIYRELDELAQTSLEDFQVLEDAYQTRWATVANKLTRSVMSSVVYSELRNQNLNMTGKPISIDKFKSALKVIYPYENVEEKNIDSAVNTAINDTMKISDKAYTNNATNSFKRETMKNLEGGFGG